MIIRLCMNKKITKRVTQVISPLVVMLIVPIAPVLADCEPCTPEKFCNPLRYCTIQDLLLAILDAVIMIMFPIVILSLVYAGFLFVKAQGQPGELEKARSAFFWGVIGGVIVLGAKGLALAIEATVGELLK